MSASERVELGGKLVDVTLEPGWNGWRVLVDGKEVGRVERMFWRGSSRNRYRYQPMIRGHANIGDPQRTRKAAVVQVLVHHEDIHNGRL